MAELHVFVDNQPLAPIVTTSSNTPSTASNVKITDGTNIVTMSSSGSVGTALAVSGGFVFGAVTLAGVSGDTTGTLVDAGSARSSWTGFAIPTGTLTGNLLLELSFDGGNWIPAGPAVAIVAATNVGIFSTGHPARYARVSLSGSAGTGTVTVDMMAA